MNIHACTAQSSADVRTLMGVEFNLISACTGKPHIGLIQDSALAHYLMGNGTRKEQYAALHQVHQTKGDIAAARYLHDRQLEASAFMQQSGFSIGLDDFATHYPHRSTGIHALAHTSADIMDRVPNSNALAVMVRGGTRGSAINLTQLLSCVGFQSVLGTGTQSPVTRPESSPFVSRSFTQGLTEDDMWHHCVAAREGMIETAIKTAVVGYTMRKLVKSMENLAVEYDGTVRTCRGGNVVQFRATHGEPGEAVGVLAAQSIGQPLTQITLNTFHLTGVSQSRGLPALQRIICPPAGNSTRGGGVWNQLPMPYMHMRTTLFHCMRNRPTPTSTPAPWDSLECKMRGVPCTFPCHEVTIVNLPVCIWKLSATLRKTLGCTITSCTTKLRIRGFTENMLHTWTGSQWAKPQAFPSLDALEYSTLPPLDTHGYSLDPNHVCDTLGIEAARTVLLQRLQDILTGILKHHLQLLADNMTASGYIANLNATETRRANTSAIMSNACFENTSRVFARAACTNAVDPLVHASSRLSMGMMPALGTEFVDIVKETVVETPDVHMDATDQVLFNEPVRKRRRFDSYMI